MSLAATLLLALHALPTRVASADDPERAFAELLKKDSTKRVWKVVDTRDEGLLRLIARKDPDERVRLAAVERVKSQAVLELVARVDDEWSVRQAAVGRLDDQALLDTIARSDGHWSVRRAALQRLERPDAAATFLSRDPHEAVREAVARATSAQEVLIRLLRDPSPAVRQAAAGKVEGIDLLLATATTDSDPDVARAATRRMTDPALLRRIVREAAQEAARRAGCARLVGDWRADLRVTTATCDAHNCRVTILNGSRHVTYTNIRYRLVTKRILGLSDINAGEGSLDARLPPGQPTLLGIGAAGFGGSDFVLLEAEADTVDPLPEPCGSQP